MKKTIAAITAACLLLATGCGLHLTGSLEAYGPKETVPAIRVAVGGEEADYGVTLHEWDGFTDAALDYADTANLYASSDGIIRVVEVRHSA